MGRIAVLGEEHWKKYLPTAYAGIKDPEKFFLELENSAEQAIEALEESLAPEPQPGETTAQRAGWLTTARRDAESTVLRAMVLLPAEAETVTEDGTELSSTGQSETPEDRELRTALNEFAEAKAELDLLTTPAAPTTPDSPTQA